MARRDAVLKKPKDTKGTIIRRKHEYDMVDHDSCTGLDIPAKEG